MIPSASALISTIFAAPPVRADTWRERLLEGRFRDERRGQPDARGPRSFQDFDARRHFERAPMFNRGVARKKSPSSRECEAS